VTAPIYLIDISAYLHRAMHVVYGDRAPTVSPTDTSFIDHACVMLANTMEKLRVERMAVICDSTQPSFRCDFFPAYKAERKAHTPVFAAQMPRFFDALRDIDVTVYDESRYEADDLIATLAGEEEGIPYVIVSHDKDLLALVNDEARISTYNPMTDSWTREADVFKKFEVKAPQLYDYLGLVGDTSDGIPGVEGIGPKTAAKLLARFDNIDDMYASESALQATVGKKQFESLLANKDNAIVSRKLARPVICDVVAISGHGDMDAPEADFVRGATLTTHRRAHDL
jgi:DNA polymerase-1